LLLCRESFGTHATFVQKIAALLIDVAGGMEGPRVARIERDGVEQRFFVGCWGIFGHGNVAGIGEALFESPDLLPYHMARNEQSMVHILVLLPMAVAGMVVLWYRWRTRSLVAQSRQLEQLVTARTRELEASRDELDQRVRDRTAQLESELAERQRLQQQLVQAQKLESVGRLAGGVAHDINNLMTAVLGYAQLAEEAAPDKPALREDLRQIRLAGERAAGVSQQLLAFGRRQIFNPQVINLNEVLLGLDNMLRKSVGASIELVPLLGEELWNVRVDPVQIEQVIINLVSNARDAMPTGGKLWLETHDLTLGAETASVMCEISQTVFGLPRHSRQSQVWVHFPGTGWKIIAAHVSNAPARSPADWQAYADQSAAAVGLPLDAAAVRMSKLNGAGLVR